MSCVFLVLCAELSALLTENALSVYSYSCTSAKCSNRPTGLCVFSRSDFFVKFAIFFIKCSHHKEIFNHCSSELCIGCHKWIANKIKLQLLYVFFIVLCDLFRAIDTRKLPERNDYSKLHRLFDMMAFFYLHYRKIRN